MMDLDIHTLAMAALVELENGLNKPPLRIVDSIMDSPYKLIDVSVLMEKEELEKPINEIKEKIIIPASFALTNYINNLGPSWNTMVRLSPDQENAKWSRVEMNNISIIIKVAWSLKYDCETLTVAVMMTEDKNWEANEWIRSIYKPVDTKGKTPAIGVNSKAILIYGEWYEVSGYDYDTYISKRITKNG